VAVPKVSAAKARFDMETESGSVPTWISGSVKGPTFQFPKEWSTAALNELTEAQTTYCEAMSKATEAFVNWVRACHETNVRHAKESIDCQTKCESLLIDLTNLTATIIVDAGRTNMDLWKLYVNGVVGVFGNELDDTMYDVAAQSLADVGGCCSYRCHCRC
jgi:hypothetical protein